MTRHNQELINRWQSGDTNAFSEIVREWQRPVFRFLSRIVNQPDDVPDLCQEVFLRIHRATQRYRENGSFHTWVYRIALNVARDAARLDRRRPKAGPLADTESCGDPPDTQAERDEVHDCITRCIADLPAEHREVLVLRHYEGMSFAEMSRLLDAPESTLKSRFTASLQQLQRQLRIGGFAPEDECHEL